ncbi:MAG: metalloregulator ArsR/SmtB family transcription factor [Patescibacteria group bacterium]
MKDLERILKALANKRRLAILKYLKGGRASVSDIAKTIKLSFKATSKHLTILTGAGVLEKEQEGLVMWHSLSSKKNPLVSKTLDIM